MTDRQNTQIDDYRLRNVMLDGQPVEFILATVMRCITWTGGPGPRVRELRWYGEIVSTTDQPKIDETVPIHDLVAETADGRLVEGFFTITSAHGQGFDIVGSGELTVS